MTTDDRPSFWGEELDHLSTHAAALFGEEAISAAIERTLAQLRGTRRGGVSMAVSLAEFNEALKEELRRLVRPH